MVALQDDRGGQWRVQAVSVAPASFQNRKSLPKAWQGLRDEQLSELSGIPNCVFVHASGESPSFTPVKYKGDYCSVQSL